MGKIAITGGAGGITSDDVTATRNHVIKGYTTITSDSDDEVVQGTIEDRGDGAVVSYLQGREDHLRRMWIMFKNGWYHRIPAEYGGVVHESYIYITYDQIKNLFGIDRNKMLTTQTIAGETGTIPSHANGSRTWAIGWDGNLQSVWARLPHRNGYYAIPSNDPWLYIHRDQLVATLGMQGAPWLNNKWILGYQGTIPRWVCTTGDVITAWNNEGFAWDDGYAGRGRGIVAKIPNNHRIENANWVFLSSPNLHPHNIRAGVNINGVVGTLHDVAGNRVAFNGATFDNVLVSGVANEMLNDIGGNVPTDGVFHSGVILTDSNTLRFNTHIRANSPTRNAGVWLAHSVNLTDFSSILVECEMERIISSNTREFWVGVNVIIVPIDIVYREGGVRKIRAGQEGRIQYTWSEFGYYLTSQGEGSRTIANTSHLRGQHYIFLGITCYLRTSSSSYFVDGVARIKHLEFRR